jgi:hypothetical protein
VFTIEPLALLAGSLPVKQRRLVEAWAEIHGEELGVAWNQLQSGQLPSKIDPLN